MHNAQWSIDNAALCPDLFLADWSAVYSATAALQSRTPGVRYGSQSLTKTSRFGLFG